MKIYLFQFDVSWLNPSENYQKIHDLLKNRKITSESLFVFPEMFSIGFVTSLSSKIKEKLLDLKKKDIQFLSFLAKEYQVTLVGSSIVYDSVSQKYKNQSLIINKFGELLNEYTKIHPFSFGGEAESYLSGNNLIKLDVCPFVLQPTICYDLRFPELFRWGVDRGVNLFTVQANWPKGRMLHWETLLRARAIENQSYVVGVNRVGVGNEIIYAGGSVVISPQGRNLNEPTDKESLIEVEINLPSLEKWRKTFPALVDRKDERFYQ